MVQLVPAVSPIISPGASGWGQQQPLPHAAQSLSPTSSSQKVPFQLHVQVPVQGAAVVVVVVVVGSSVVVVVVVGSSVVLVVVGSSVVVVVVVGSSVVLVLVVLVDVLLVEVEVPGTQGDWRASQSSTGGSCGGAHEQSGPQTPGSVRYQ